MTATAARASTGTNSDLVFRRVDFSGPYRGFGLALVSTLALWVGWGQGLAMEAAALSLAAALGLVQGPKAMALGLLAAFAVFRLFDILKPWPIRAFDRSVHGGVGIMIDDVLAGVFSAAVLCGGILLLQR